MLTKTQFGGLFDALLDAFTIQDWDILLRRHLNKVRECICAPGSLRHVTYEIISAAERGGWVADLIDAARQENPLNPYLRKFCAEHPELVIESVGVGASGTPAAGHHDQRAEVAEALTRMALGRRRLQYVWLASEDAIRDVAAMDYQMMADVTTARTFAQELTEDQTILLGEFAGDFVNMIWRFRGPSQRDQLGRLLDTAEACARRVFDRRRADAESILAKVANNHLDTWAWCRPDAVLREREVVTNLRPFTRAERHAKSAEVCDRQRYGLNGYDTVDHLLSRGYVNSLGPEGRWPMAERKFRKAELLLDGGRIDLQGYLAAFRGTIDERAGRRKQAIEHFRWAAHLFEEFARTPRHHLVASCRMRLRQLKDSHTRSLKEDVQVLRTSAVRFSDLVNLNELRRIGRI